MPLGQTLSKSALFAPELHLAYPGFAFPTRYGSQRPARRCGGGWLLKHSSDMAVTGILKAYCYLP